MLKLLCLAVFAWHAFVLVRGRRGASASALCLAVAAGLVWAAVAGIAIYKVVAMLPFDWMAVWSALDDARRTLVAVLGEHGVVLALGALGALAAAATGVAWLLLRAFRAAAARLGSGPRSALLCMGLLSYLAAGDLWFAASELVLYNRWSVEALNTPAPRVPDYSGVAVRSRESVFILQLESVNTYAVFERTGDAKGYRALIPQPGVETILREGAGVLFPFFWANGAQTNRAWESIWCSVSGNVSASFSLDPLRLARRTCLPGHLARAGYASVLLYSYFDLDFFNLKAFAKRAGFQDVAHGPGLMAEGDRRHSWGYDDCVFYRRAFEYLARSGLDKRERVFAYFEVGMNHAPFRDTMKYPDAHPHRQPASMLEHYQNSLAEQDHCLLEFWQRFRALGRDDIHLFILPDHGLWLPGLPQGPDPTFATWLVYVPPAGRKAEFRPRAVLAPVASQAEVYPTILELLGGQMLPASFAFALRGDPAPRTYEDCVTLGAAGPQLIVRRNGQRVTYLPRTGEVVGADGRRLASDLRSFLAQHGCRGG